MSEEANIILPTIEIKKPKEKPFECPVCGKKYKTEKSFLKHLESHEEENVEEQIEEVEQEKSSIFSRFLPSGNSDPNEKLEKLQKELENLLLSNPSIDISKPCGNTTLEKIYTMSEDELKARIFDAKRGLTSGLDMKIADSTLGFANMIVGNMLGCVEELEESVRNDITLRNATKDMMSMSVLSYVPSNVKVAGLYALNVGSALQKSKIKKQRCQVEIENI